MSHGLTMKLLPEMYAVCRLEPGDAVPDWAFASPFSSVSLTPTELSVVCAEDAVPEATIAERGWRCLHIDGNLDFSETGIISGITGALSETGIPVFVISTYDTDYLMVKDQVLLEAAEALIGAGFPVDSFIRKAKDECRNPMSNAEGGACESGS